MNNWIFLIVALIAGLLGGGVFFGGLWFTVKKGLKLANPSLLFLASFFVRSSITLVIFYFAASGSWQRMLMCFAGFLLARYVIMVMTKNSNPSGPSLK